VIAPVPVLGIPIDRVTMADAVAEIERLVALGRQRHTTHQVVTVNADFVVNALDDPQVHGVLRDADLAIADGMPVVWGARGVGLPVPSRVTGADLVPALAAHSAETGLRIHFYGSDETVAERAAALLVERAPGARITADSGEVIKDPHHPPDRVLAAIAAVDADVLCVALGNPKQERFIAATRDRLRTPVMIGVGGTLDLLVGVRRRAPRLVQRIGLEWVYRAVQEPGRLGPRYARDIVVLGPTLARHVLAVRRATRHGLDVAVGDEDVVDLGPAEALSVATIGELLARRRRARQLGQPFELNTSAAVAAQLRALRLGYLVER
jgi:N-acetylglucosaminyldiphosphoundecaprenol N-acetyl-beta-D-mannosaminyltransferase